jgi:hypothetical protein
MAISWRRLGGNERWEACGNERNCREAWKNNNDKGNKREEDLLAESRKEDEDSLHPPAVVTSRFLRASAFAE